MSDDDGDRGDYLAKIVAQVCLTVIVVAAIAGMTVTAVMTDRNLVRVEALTFIVTLWLAILGGMSAWGWARRYRWRIERELANGGTKYPTGQYQPELKGPPDATP